MRVQTRFRQLARNDLGMAAMQSVMILAVSALVLLGMRVLWDPKFAGSGGMFVLVQQKFDVIFRGGEESSGDPANPSDDGSGGSGSDDSGTGSGGSDVELTDEQKQQIARLAADVRRMEGLSRLATLAGNSMLAESYKATANAGKLAIANIKGPEALKTEIAAIAASTSVELAAKSLLKAIEQRVPITYFVTAPILDGVGQLTEEFVRWWRTNQ